MGNSRAGLVYGVHAVCTFAGGGGGGAFLRNRGFAAAFVRNGAGDYSLAFDAAQAIDSTGAQHGFTGLPNGASGSSMSCAIVDATHVRVITAIGEGPVNTDMTFTLAVIDLGLV